MPNSMMTMYTTIIRLRSACEAPITTRIQNSPSVTWALVMDGSA